MMGERWGLWVIARADGVPINKWLSGFDPEAHHGRGDADFTPNPDFALTFPSVAAAMEYWKTQSTTVPLRPDGKPNRPLTSFTVSPMRLDQESDTWLGPRLSTREPKREQVRDDDEQHRNPQRRLPVGTEQREDERGEE